MHKISKDNAPNCPRCRMEEGSFLHMFWQCHLLKSFWHSVHSFTKSVLKIEFNLNPCLYLLNDMPDLRIDSKKCRILLIITYLAKKCILLLWKNESPPSFQLFLDQLSQLLPLEKRTLEKNNRGHIFQELWSPLFSYLSRGEH